MPRKRSAAAPSGATILAVDDQQEALDSLQLVLEREGHRVLLAESGQRALELFGQHSVQLMLVDYFMPRMTGENLITEIRKVDPEVQIVLQTGYSGEKPPREMLRTLDIQGYHDKTDGPEKLLLWVDVALKAYRQLERVREAEALRVQILNNVSHEFRTPLHIVLGYTELLQEEADPTARRTLDRIQTSAQGLLDLVNDFLDLSQLDTGGAHLEPRLLAGSALREEFVRHAEILIREKPIHFEYHAADDLPAIAADPTKLRVILRNLLSNAIKFTPAGRVTVHVEASGDTVAVAIADTGIGIAPADHERIFEPFHQIDGGITRQRDGTGVGLTIVRRLARLMGGDVTVESRLGEGATFRLALPRADVATHRAAPAAAASGVPA